MICCATDLTSSMRRICGGPNAITASVHGMDTGLSVILSISKSGARRFVYCYTDELWPYSRPNVAVCVGLHATTKLEQSLCAIILF